MTDSEKCQVIGCDKPAITKYQWKPCCSEHYFFLRRERSMRLKQTFQKKKDSLTTERQVENQK